MEYRLVRSSSLSRVVRVYLWVNVVNPTVITVIRRVFILVSECPKLTCRRLWTCPEMTCMIRCLSTFLSTSMNIVRFQSEGKQRQTSWSPRERILCNNDAPDRRAPATPNWDRWSADRDRDVRNKEDPVRTDSTPDPKNQRERQREHICNDKKYAFTPVVIPRRTLPQRPRSKNFPSKERRECTDVTTGYVHAGRHDDHMPVICQQLLDIVQAFRRDALICVVHWKNICNSVERLEHTIKTKCRRSSKSKIHSLSKCFT